MLQKKTLVEILDLYFRNGVMAESAHEERKLAYTNLISCLDDIGRLIEIKDEILNDIIDDLDFVADEEIKNLF